MSPVDASLSVKAPAYIPSESGTAASTSARSDTVPESPPSSTGVGTDLPVLSAPFPSSLSLASLLDALNFTVQDTSKESSEESVKAKADAILKNNDSKLEELGKQLDMLKSDGVLGIFQQIFSALAAVFAVVAGAVLTAFAGPVGVAVLVPAIIGLANTITSAASGGEMNSITSAFLQGACGVPAETANIAGGVTSMIVGLAGAVAGLVFTGGSSTAAKVMGKVVANASKVMATTAKINTISSAATEILNGACGVADASLGYVSGTSKAKVKDLEATLEKLNQGLQADQDFLKAVMERTQDLLSQVMDVVKTANEARKAVLMVSPNLA